MTGSRTPLNKAALCAIVVLVALAPAAWGSNRVEIIINPQLWAGGEITASVERYIQDLRWQGYEASVTATHFATQQSLRGHLQSRYGSDEGLAGAFLIGDLPIPRFQTPSNGTTPSDLYYKDLTGIWEDTTGNGRFDSHSGDIRPNIFIGRLMPSTSVALHPGRTEASLLNDYFDRNHAYRHGRLTASSDSLAYIDNDWSHMANTWSRSVGHGTTGDVILYHGNDAYKSHYQQQLAGNAYEHVLATAHGNLTSHAFARNHELADLGASSLFYTIMSCNAMGYDRSSSVGAEYIWGAEGLIALGLANSGIVSGWDGYYRPLGQGATFGEAFMNLWETRFRWGIFPPYQYRTTNTLMNYEYGLTMLGDPLLVTQAYIPEPGVLVLLACGGVAMLRRRRPA